MQTRLLTKAVTTTLGTFFVVQAGLLAACGGDSGERVSGLPELLDVESVVRCVESHGWQAEVDTDGLKVLAAEGATPEEQRQVLQECMERQYEPTDVGRTDENVDR